MANQLQPKPFMTYAGMALSDQSYTVNISYGDPLSKDGIIWSVGGVSKTPLNFKLSAKYGDLFNGLIPGAELLQKTGDASLTTGIFSQKFYQGGGNLDMSVEFRIYDDGKSNLNPVIAGARNLANMTVADSVDINNAVGHLADAGGQIGGAFVGAGKEGLKGNLKGASQKLINAAKQAMANINNRRVTLSIMNLFSCSMMVITDVNVTYSGSHTHTGPLFGDFSVSLMSLQAITRGGGVYGVDTILQDQNYKILINGQDSKNELDSFAKNKIRSKGFL